LKNWEAKMEELLQFLRECAEEYQNVLQELKESEDLLRQARMELEKLTAQSAQAAVTIRQMEANIDRYPAREVQKAYKQAQSLQVQLLTLRERIGQIEGQYKALERYARHLRRLLDLGRRMEEAAPPEREAVIPSELVLRIVEAREQEKRELARQMHDGPAQALTNLILQAEICERLFSRDRAKAQEELANLKKAASETFQQIRNFIFNLHPMMLDDLGLIPTLRLYLQEFEGKTGIKTIFNLTGQEKRLPSRVEIVLFRAIQELLDNVHRHSRASQVQVSIDITGNRVKAIVEDNGVGFDVEAVLPSGAIGISGVRENIEALGGEMSVESAIGRGTRVAMDVPIPETKS
jgi:two-component system sensor histidine kinase DegS